MSKQIVAFDVDGTLIDDNDQERTVITELLMLLWALKFEIWVWSGGGQDYAERWVEKLGLGPFVVRVLAKDPALKPHLAIDDAEGADLGLLATLIVQEKKMTAEEKLRESLQWTGGDLGKVIRRLLDPIPDEVIQRMGEVKCQEFDGQHYVSSTVGHALSPSERRVLAMVVVDWLISGGNE